MKRKVIKYGIFGIIILALGWNLSQCTGGNPGNMKQYEIINQIKTKMKKEMDAINFEVNFEDYEFKVEVPQSLSDFGYVTLKDKRYNYEPIRVYDGNLQKLEEDQIGVNPIIFVYSGYLDYLNKRDEVVKQKIQEYFKNRNIDYSLMKFHERDFTGTVVYPFSLEIVNGTPNRNEIDASEIFLWKKENKLSINEYMDYYKNKKALNFDYENYDLFMSKGVLYSYKVRNIKNLVEIESEIRSIINQDRVFVQLNN